ncbi:MAG: BlaI/MecI/CopY family transcriptional regulator [Lachnospiraceae bacterium]|nr:BlaI/MecI/CopY family transcriptional regulator [Lachnospiraceae bacterium]
MTREKLFDGEYRFMQIIWDHAPINSGELVNLCAEAFDWKKSTTYTMIKKMCEKGYIISNNAKIDVLVSKELARKEASADFVEKTFDGSFADLFVAFYDGKKLTEKEALELKKLIDTYKE